MRSGGRRGYAVVLLLGVLGVAACGEQDSPGVAQEPTPTETPTPPYEPPELDRTELDANLASLSPKTELSSTTTCTPRARRAPGSSPPP